MANKNLSAARAAKNDEFYTRLTDIENELWNYRDKFKDKIIYCNCDDGQWSNFWRYFYINFEFFGLKELIATSYHDGISHTDDPEDIAYKYSYKGGYGKTDYVANGFMEGVTKTQLEGDGDFRSKECIAILDYCDMVVTNPPFSLFREYIAQLIEHNKKFIIIGNMNAITYKEVFPLIKENHIWTGYKHFGGGMNMIQPKEFFDESKTKSYTIDENGNIIKNIMGVIWFTNVDTSKRHHVLELYCRYNEVDYPKYDNYDAIECGKVDKIPCDYTGVIGVPITFIDNFCPNQFEIIGSFNAHGPKDADQYVDSKMTEIISNGKSQQWNGPVVNKEGLYKRICIRWKPEAMPHIDEDGVITYG